MLYSIRAKVLSTADESAPYILLYNDFVHGTPVVGKREFQRKLTATYNSCLGVVVSTSAATSYSGLVN